MKTNTSWVGVTFIGAVLCLAVVSCDGTQGRHGPDELFGIWVSWENADGSGFIIEMKEFDSDHPELSGVVPVYFIGRIPEVGGEVTIVQYGYYDIRYEDGVPYWITMPLWYPESEGSIGETYGNEIFSIEEDSWQLSSSVLSSGVRTMQRVDEYP